MHQLRAEIMDKQERGGDFLFVYLLVVVLFVCFFKREEIGNKGRRKSQESIFLIF